MSFRRKFFAHLAAMAFVLVALQACARMDVSTRSYDSHAAALNAGALGGGAWLPKELPESATNIRETHDVDTNEVWFSYLDESAETPSRCMKAKRAEVRAPRVARVREVAQFAQSVHVLLRSGRAQLYRCMGEEYMYYLAVDPKSNQAFGWSLGDS